MKNKLLLMLFICGFGQTEINIKECIDKGLNFAKKISPYGGVTMPYGDNINPPYAMGMHYGLDLKLKEINDKMPNNISLSFLGMYTPNDNSSLEPLTSNGIFLGYTLEKGKLFIKPSAGMLSQKGMSTLDSDGDGVGDVAEGTDIGVKVEGGYNLGKISIYGGGIHTPTTFLGLEQTSAFFTAGLKYNF